MAEIILLTILCTCSVIRLVLEIIKFHTHLTPVPAPVITNNKPEQTAEEKARLAEQKKKFDDEMKAFQEMMNYNADKAYGINAEETTNDR